LIREIAEPLVLLSPLYPHVFNPSHPRLTALFSSQAIATCIPDGSIPSTTDRMELSFPLLPISQQQFTSVFFDFIRISETYTFFHFHLFSFRLLSPFDFDQIDNNRKNTSKSNDVVPLEFASSSLLYLVHLFRLSPELHLEPFFDRRL